jgi:hypothetical protein
MIESLRLPPLWAQEVANIYLIHIHGYKVIYLEPYYLPPMYYFHRDQIPWHKSFLQLLEFQTYHDG